MRRFRRPLCYAIFLLHDPQTCWLVLAARCSIAKIAFLSPPLCCGCQGFSGPLCGPSLRMDLAMLFFSACLFAATLHFCELASTAAARSNFRLFRGTYAEFNFSSLHGVLCARAHLDLRPSAVMRSAAGGAQSELCSQRTGGGLGAARLSHPRRRGSRLLSSS